MEVFSLWVNLLLFECEVKSKKKEISWPFHNEKNLFLTLLLLSITLVIISYSTVSDDITQEEQIEKQNEGIKFQVIISVYFQLDNFINGKVVERLLPVKNRF